MLYIRTDGNAEIGTGHVMRCLSIAHMQRKLGRDCSFITADKTMQHLLEEQGFVVICLNSVWNDFNQETEKTAQLISDRKIEKLLIDSYFVTPDYLSRLRYLTYVIYMDDINAFTYPCNALINYNIYAQKLDYPSRYPNTRLLLGPVYAPLREEFCGLPPCQTRSHAQNVLVTTGGGDSFNVAGRFVERAKNDSEMSRMHFHIVAGNFNTHLPKLYALAASYSGVTVHQNVGNMSRLMLDCDIAVSAGGTTLYELCACGTPSVIFACADNQLEAVDAFGAGYMISCGDFRKNEETCLSRLLQEIKRISEDVKLRNTMAKRCRGLVTPHKPLLL